MTVHSYVPDAFGYGLIIHLVKDKIRELVILILLLITEVLLLHPPTFKVVLVCFVEFMVICKGHTSPQTDNGDNTTCYCVVLSVCEEVWHLHATVRIPLFQSSGERQMPPSPLPNVPLALVYGRPLSIQKLHVP